MCYPSTSKWIRLLLLTFLVAFASSSLLAEDTEIFSAELPPAEPNILFLLDQSGSMNSPIGTAGATRLSALQAAFNTVVADPDVAGLRLGLMGFSSGVDKKPFPHGVSFPTTSIDDEVTPIMLSNLVSGALKTASNRGYFSLADDNLPDPVTGQIVRDYLPQILASWTAYGTTPVLDAYYEAALYFKGEQPLWGSASPEKNHAAHPSTYAGSILSEISTELTGGTVTCDAPDCGLNCVSEITSSKCGFGEASCHLGTNCTEQTVADEQDCNLGSIADCMAANPAYVSCSVDTDTDCSTTCSGEIHLESGACLGTETQSCSTNTSIDCVENSVRTFCDNQEYRCEETKEIATDMGAATYISPIINQCQSNAIILLSDGQPYVKDEAGADKARALVNAMIGSTAPCAAVPGQVLPETATNSLADGRCGTELAAYLSTQDQMASVDGDNTVQTYTVGFGVDTNPEAESFLKSLAQSGGGKYFPATNTAALVVAFKSIISDIGTSARSFAAPVYTVDPNSLLSHSDDIYLPLFENSSLPAWAGNIKKFKLNIAGKIVDANGIDAIDSTGALKPEAVDFWGDKSVSKDASSSSVTGDGAANNLDPASRTLLIDKGVNLVALDDSNVSKAQLGNGAMSDAYKAQLLSYIQGYQADKVTPRYAMGDILHSKPTVISYSDKQVLFFGTNEGYLHAIDAADSAPGSTGGKELFAYMPSSLLSNIGGMFKNTELTGSLKRIYGVDGPIAAWIVDKNSNGKVDTADGDEAYLFFGLRRGGSEYYALNVTDPSAPTLAWKIQSQGAFAQLGETWSKPILAKLRHNSSGTVQFDDVLVFGGGYDNRVDDETLANSGVPISNVKGNGVYIVNAKTGDLIWSYASGDLQHSVPGDIRVLDVDNNGSIDRLYFGDVGGNIWRADLNIDDVDSDDSLYDVKKHARVSKFASLGGSGVNARKFFYEPDVSLFKHNGTNTIVVSVGSGYRSHPLNESIEDSFYVLYDENVFGIPATAPTALTLVDLAESSALAGQDFLPNYKGWYKKLVNGKGEKVLASPITFQNKVIFTTFTNTVTAVNSSHSCTALTGSETRAYVLDLMSAGSTADIDGNGTVDASDESVVISRGDILDSPQLVFNAPSDCNTEGCDQHVDIRVGKSLVPLIDKNTKDGNANLGDFLPRVFWVNE